MNWSPAGSTDSGESSYVVSGTFTSGIWQFEVRALDDAGNAGPWSAAASITIPSALPAAPTGLSATVDSPYQVGLTWSDTASGLTGFIVERQDPGDATWQDIATTTATAYTDDLVQPETAYSYRVVATNGNGGSMPSDPVTAETGLLAPTELSATVLSGNQMQLDWSTATTVGDSFTIVESATVNPYNWTVAASSIPIDATSTVISNPLSASGTFSDNTTYYFAIYKCQAGMPNSAFSSTASVSVLDLPAAPKPFYATINPNPPLKIDLAWTDTNGGQATYYLQRTSNGGQTWVTIASLPPGSDSFVDTGVIRGLTYEYQVTGVNSAGLSASVEAPVTGDWPDVGQAFQPDTQAVGQADHEYMVPEPDAQSQAGKPDLRATPDDASDQPLPPDDVQVSGGQLTGLSVSWTNQSPGIYSTEVDWTDPSGITGSQIVDGSAQQLQIPASDVSGNPGTWQFEVYSFTNDGNQQSAPASPSYPVPWLPPVVHNDTYSAVHGMPTTLDVLSQDASDPQDATMSVAAITTGPSHGVVTINSDGTLTYTSCVGFKGVDTFQYTVKNSQETSKPATVTVDVTECVPQCWSDLCAYAWNSSYDESTGLWTETGQLEADTCNPDGVPLTYSVVDKPDGATYFQLNADGSFTMTYPGTDCPPYNWQGPAFTYKCNDGIADSNIATAGWNLDNYWWGSHWWWWMYDQQLNVLPGADCNGQLFPSGYGYSLNSTVEKTQHGTMQTNSDGSFTYTAKENFTGEDWFTYTIADSQGDVSPCFTVFFSVANDVVNIDSANDEYDPIRDATDVSSPGLVVPADTAINADGVPGFADGYGLYGNSDWQDEEETLVPIYITLPDAFDMQNGRMDIEYSGSNPAAVTRSGSGTTDDPYQYQLPASGGALRLWTAYSGYDDCQRTSQSISQDDPNDPNDSGLGFYVPSGVYDANDVANMGGYPGFEITLYVERVRPSLKASENMITVSFDTDGSGNRSTPETIYVADPPTLNIDSLNVSSGLPNLAQCGSQVQAACPSPTGKIIVVDDSPVDGVPAFAVGVGGNSWNADDNSKFVPLVVTLPQNTNLSQAMLNFSYDGSDPSNIEVDDSGPDKSYLPAPGTLRLWTKDGDQERNDSGIADADPGDYIAPNAPFSASVLSWSDIPGSTDEQTTIYVEAVRASASTADQTITLTVDVDGTGNFIPAGSALLTAVQDTAPDYTSSGLAGVAQGADGGNPMSNAFTGAVRLSDGIVNYATTDFSVPATGFACTVARVWTDQPGLVVNPSFGNGEIMTQLPYLIQATGSIIAVIDGQPYYFDQISQGVYKERFFGLEQLTYDASTDEYQFVDTTGMQIVFNGFTIQNDDDPAEGMYERGAMMSVTDADNNTIIVTGYDWLGNTTRVTEGSDVFTYAYTRVGDDAERLTSVSLARNGYTIAQAQYTYYSGDDDATNGNDGYYDGDDGDLEQVRVSTSDLNLAPLQEVGGSYYRYYSGGDLADAVTGLAYARLVASVFGSNAASATPVSYLDQVDVSNYADQFEYDDWNRAVEQDVVGAGASSVGNPWAIGEFTYAYDIDGGCDGTVRGAGINAWSQETTITLPSDSDVTQTVYTNYAGEPLLSSLTDTADDVNSALDGLTWNTFFAYDSEGRLVMTAEPSTQVTPDDSIPDLLDKQTDGTYRLMSNCQGLVEGTDFYDPSDTTPGAVPGYVEDTYVENGQQASTEALQSFYLYKTISDGDISIYPVSDERVFADATSDVNDTSGSDTYFKYDNDGLQITEVTETLPVVGAEQNALGGTGTIVTNYDSNGRVANVTDADGYKTTYYYDSLTGAVTKTVAVVDVSSGATITTFSVPDLLGRPIQTTDGNGNVTTIAYVDGLLQSTVTTTPAAGPVEEVVDNLGSGTITTLATVAAIATGPDSPTGGSMQAVSKVWLDFAGRTLETQRYSGLPGGTYTTLDDYDDAGNLYWTEDAVGTITETDFDGLGRPTEVWVGTSEANETEVESEQYDDNGVGDGTLTQTTQYTNANTPNHVTTSYFDWRDRLVAQDNGLQITFNTLDNLGEVTQSDIYDATKSAVLAFGAMIFAPSSSALRAQTVTWYDDQGRAYESDVYSVNPSSGLVGNYLATEMYHDGRGDVVATLAPGGLLTTTTYDGAGRVTLQQSGSEGETTPGTIGTAVQSVATQYDDNSNPILVTTSLLNPDGTTRVSYVDNWYNAANQLTATANYGTNVSPRPSSPPASSTTVLVTGYQYDAGGFLSMTTDPTGMQTTYSNDYLGRVIQETVDSAISWASPFRLVTGYSYDGLNRTVSVTTYNVTPAVGTTPSTTQLQQTRYVYVASTSNGSDINSNDLLSEIDYPDGTTQLMAYDSLGELITQTNRDGSKHLYLYDLLGRQVIDAVYAWAAGVDQTVTELGDTYDTLGDLVLATSYGTGSTIVNQVENMYDGLGNLVTQYQSHSGAVNIASTPAVQYQYATSYAGASNYSRLTGVTYPGGTQVSYAYSGLDDSISRITSVADGSQTVETYRYLGPSTVIGATLPEPNATELESLDNFGNVSAITWTQGGTVQSNGSVSGGTPLVNLAYTYDQVGDVLSRQDVLADAAGAALDQTYSYDAMHRLTGYSQGTLNTTTGTISSPTVSASWSLDSQGNRYGGVYGNSYNSQNQPTANGDIYSAMGYTTTVNVGSSTTVGLKYDAWGRVVSILPNTSSAQTFEYDALGRMIQVLRPNCTKPSTDNYYDGSQEILALATSDGSLVTRNVWSPADGRLIVRDAVVAKLYEIGPGTIPANEAGGMQRLYPLTDAQGSVVAVVGPTTANPSVFTVQERYVYDVNGRPTALGPTWNVNYAASGLPVGYSLLGWDWLYQGQRWRQANPTLLTPPQDIGLYQGPGGQWYNPNLGRPIQPNTTVQAMGGNAYITTPWESFGTYFAPVIIGIGVTLATGGLGAPAVVTAGLGGAAMFGFGSYASGGNARTSCAICGDWGNREHGRRRGRATRRAERRAALFGACEAGFGTAAGIAIGAAEGAAFGATEAFVRTGLTTGDPVDAVMAAWENGLIGGVTGGALGGIFHEVCFAAGMQVDVQDAERIVTKNVEDVLKGDLVVSRDENDPHGRLVLVPVDETFRRLADHLRIVDIHDAEGNTGVIRTTDEHPFFERVRGQIAARDLRAGDTLVTRGGDCVRVAATRREEHPEGIPVYNFRVPGTHTYFVRPNDWTGDAVWVHNACAVKTEEGYDLELELKEGWSEEQIAQAQAKVASLNAAAERSELVRSVPNRGSTTARSMYLDEGFDVEDGMDVDHVIDLQLGGADAVRNLSPLDLSVNRSLGSQIYHATKGLEIGALITGVRFV